MGHTGYNLTIKEPVMCFINFTERPYIAYKDSFTSVCMTAQFNEVVNNF